MAEGKEKQYTNGEVTIVWKPDACIHSGICVKGLPEVFDPKARPWVNIEGAGTEKLVEQVKNCPSGALSYFMNDPGDDTSTKMNTEVEIMADGPLLVYGSISLKGKEGEEILENTKTAFCRCGASAKKPFCDGSHRKIGFEG